MTTIARYILLFFILLTGIKPVFAQQGFYIPLAGKVFFNGDSSTIFSNVINHGQLGVGRKGVLNFKGLQWDNNPLSLLTDESNNGNGITGEGGIIRFLLPDISLPTSINQRQILSGGYNAASGSGPAFSNLFVANPWGIQLKNSTSKIRNHLHFESGHIYADENILVTGGGTGPGSITGYDQNRFIVTGTALTGGFLLREKISSLNRFVIFPVGSSDTNYTPASVYMESRNPDDFYVRVADSVWEHVSSGQNIYPITVNKTWQIGKLQRPGKDKVTIRLQHLLNEEGQLFADNRKYSYVSMYSGSNWDTVGPLAPPSSPGYLTSGASVANAGVNTRTLTGGINAETFFTKTTNPLADTSLFQTWFRFWAYRWDWNNVNVAWTTQPEINIRYFIVQRRLSNETAFTNTDTIWSKAVGGMSYDYLKYQLTDPNSYKGTSYYRLILVDYSGFFRYSQIIPVGGHPEYYALTIWPNPTTGHFFAGIGGISPVKSIVVWDVLGRKVLEKEVNGQGIVPMDINIQGSYFVSFMSFGGKVIETKKLIVVGK